MRFDLSQVGSTNESEEFRVNSHRLAQFAAALGDDNERHASGEVACPVFAHIPVMQSMVEIVRRATNGFVLHGQHDFHFHRPIEAGQRLFTTSRLQSMRNSRAGVLLVVRSDTRTQEDAPVCTQYSTCLIQGGSVEEDRGEAPPSIPGGGAFDDATDDTEIVLPAGQAALYADAARDYSLYTLDAEAAQAHGFPAAILHGMCTMALASRAVVARGCDGDSRRLKRLGGRFSHPLFLTPGQRLSTRVRTDGGRVLQFESRDGAGNVVIKNGFAEIAP